jgi:sulfur carrier protein
MVMINIIANGKLVSLENEKSINDYILILGLGSRKAYAVAVNNEIITKDNYESTILRDGDKIEIVKAIGGGN